MQQCENRASRAQHATAAAPPKLWPRTATFDDVRAKAPPLCTRAQIFSKPSSAAVISITRRSTCARRQASRAAPTAVHTLLELLCLLARPVDVFG